MRQNDDERSASAAEPTFSSEEAALARRLERDGAAWRARVPSNDRLNARVRTLAMERPRAEIPGGTRQTTPEHEWIFDDVDLSTKRPAVMSHGPLRPAGGWAAGVAALVVVGLTAALLLGSRAVQRLDFGGLGSAQATATPTPANSVPTTQPSYSAAAQYIASAITAGGVDAANQPVGPTSRFAQHQGVFLIVRVTRAPAGQHTLTVRWYVDGTVVTPPPSAATVISITTASATVFFICPYPVDGKGTARLYWDLPDNTADAQADAWLVKDVAFVVTPVSGSVTPTVPPTEPGTPTPMPSLMPTPMPTLTPPPSPVPTP